MNENISISYKTKTPLIEKLLDQENIKILERKSFLSKIFSSKENFADIYFHTGTIDNDALKKIHHSKLTIVNSQAIFHKLLLQKDINQSKIHVLYPSIDVVYKKTKEIKSEICEKLNINPKNKILLFTAKNFKTSGIKEFIQIIASLNYDKFQVIIAGDSKQIVNLKFQMSNINLNDKIILLEDYKNMDDLFLISDIFILPTYNQNFASSVLTAMFCKCAVFVSSNNHAREVVDIFATMDDPDDRSTAFKVDALLMGMDDLKLIKKQNRKVALEHTLEKNLIKINQLIENI
jgi:glycosyltransferase involved in cell wall biosynthesis